MSYGNKELSDKKLKIFDIVDDVAYDTATSDLKKDAITFKLFSNTDIKSDLARIIWDEMMKDDNKAIFEEFINKYFGIDLRLAFLGDDLTDEQYGENLLTEYTKNMIKIYGKKKDHNDKVEVNKLYTTRKDNDLSGFINAIVNIVLYCKLKKIYTQEDCYNENLFDRIISDFTDDVISADNKIVNVNTGDFKIAVEIYKKKKKIKGDYAVFIQNELYNKAKSIEGNVKLDAKKKLIKNLKIDLNPETLSSYISSTAHRKLMRIITQLGLQNIKKDSGENLVSHIEKIYDKISSQKEDVNIMTREEFH